MFRPLFNKALRFFPVTSQQMFLFSSTSIKRIRPDLNSVHLIGNVGKQPELRFKGHVSISLASHRYYKDRDGEWATKTSWFRVIVYKSRLKDIVMKYVNKGDSILVTGAMESTQKIDDETGKYSEHMFITADKIFCLKSLTVPRDQNEEESEPLLQEETEVDGHS